MTVRTKTKRRLVIFLAGLALLAGLVGGGYAVHRHRVRVAAFADRADGIAAVQAEQYFTGMHKIGRYLGRYPKDPEAMLYYAKARENVPEPDNRHLPHAMGMLRELLELEPANAE